MKYEYSVIIEKAVPSDTRAIFEIRYHPKINESVGSRNKNRVSFEDHDRWFQDRYFGDDNQCFVLKSDDRVVGYCRFDSDLAGTYEISLAIHPDEQSKGFGAKLLEAALEKMGNKKKYRATIHESNTASLALFKKFGFIVHGVVDGYATLTR